MDKFGYNSRQESTEAFEKELEEFLIKWGVEVDVEENTEGSWSYVEGINFFSYDEYNYKGQVERFGVDLTLPRYRNYRDLSK